MLLRIIRGKLRPGTWIAFEQAYKSAIASAGPVEGLRGRWLVQERKHFAETAIASGYRRAAAKVREAMR